MKFHCIKMSQYFSKAYQSFGGDINAKVDLSTYGKSRYPKSRHPKYFTC